jgi:cellulose synthase/poly-beta-1,6-N-acetylglucosamine synthase-like glycosyltransferase
MVDLLTTTFKIVGFAFAILTIGGALELAVLSIGLLRYRLRDRIPGNPERIRKAPRIAVIVPAHNEEQTIARCVASIRKCQWEGSHWSIYVVADNCTDGTFDIAGSAGADVLVREDPERRGKGFALDFAFSKLIKRGYEAFVVVDADSVVTENFLSACASRFASGADAIQCRYRMISARTSGRSVLNCLGVNIFNQRIASRAGLGLSVGILGNGFGLTRETLQAVPYEAHSVVEDLEYHLRLVQSDFSVSFVGSAEVMSEMPAEDPAERTQRARWEGGRLRIALDYLPSLLTRVLKGQARLIEPLLELLLLPLSHYVLALLVISLVPHAGLRVYAAIAFILLGINIGLSSLTAGLSAKAFLAFLALPRYLLWKFMSLPALIANSSRNASWTRTQRKGTQT